MTKHYDDDELAKYVFDRDLVKDAESLEDHLDDCSLCRDKLATVKEIDDEMKNGETWEQVDSILGHPGRLDDIVRAHAAAEGEERRAAELLTPLLVSPLRFQNAAIEGDPAFRTAGAVRVLCSRAHNLHEENPQFSLDVATKAYTIASLLPNAKDRRFGAGVALRERANALRYLGRFDEALEALAKAEKMFVDSPGSDPFDRAIVWLIRATIFMENERLEEGRELAQSAAAVFSDYGDDFRRLSATMVEAACLLFSGAASEAALAYERVIQTSRETNQNRMLAAGLQNAANAYIAMGKHEQALAYCKEAFRLFDELRVPTERARSNWKFASALVCGGDFAEGIQRLQESRAELEQLGLTNDVALATLEWAEVRLAAGEVDGVADACRGIALEFRSAGMSRKAKIALAYLHEALRGGRATPAVVRHVRLYLENLPNRPRSVFTPLQ